MRPMGIVCVADDDDGEGMLSGGKGGRLIVPCSSRRARPEGVWRRVGRGFGGVWRGGVFGSGWGWMGMGVGVGSWSCGGIVRLVVMWWCGQGEVD
jgi:hypothetical protein